MYFVSGTKLNIASRKLSHTIAQFNGDTSEEEMEAAFEALKLIDKKLAETKAIIRVQEMELLNSVGCLQEDKKWMG